MKSNFLKSIIGALLGMGISSCSLVSVDGTNECVLIAKPLFFDGGVDMTPLREGSVWTVYTTSVCYFPIIPIRYEEKLKNIISADATPLEFNSNLVLKIINGRSPVLYKNYGEGWYKNVIQAKYRELVRKYVSQYNSIALINDRGVISSIDSLVSTSLNEYIQQQSQSLELPINVISVFTGSAIANPKQLAEMEVTSAMNQRKLTEESRQAAEQARVDTEKLSAEADNAYKNAMGMSNEQYLAYLQLQLIKSAQNVQSHVLMGSERANKIYNVK